jgi:hypothetical protein
MESQGVGSFLACKINVMLTRREVLIQLKRMGADKQSYLKSHLRDFEKYMLQNYGLKLDKKKKRKIS